MKITEIKVNKFRNISGITLDFSPCLNAIAGQNGTSKTSILGLIGHIFTYEKTEKTLLGKNFHTEFSEIFRFAYPDYDPAGEHSWLVKFDNGNEVTANSYDRKESKSIRVRVGKGKEGRGKIQLPVIYLGMGRLFPLAIEQSIVNNSSLLTTAEAKEFRDLHNEILIIIDDSVQPESITATNKSFYAAKTDTYNHLGNSAGQDNMGQIITALFSFKRLRDKLGKEYKGGILLIDELDASLFPAAQMKLVEKLYKKSKELNLQIFYTTHSLEVLEETKKKSDSKIILLDKSRGKIIPEYDLDIEKLKKDLLVLGPDAIKRIEFNKYLYCEDEEAEDMLKNILPRELKKKFRIFPTKLGQNELKVIAKRKIPDFKNSVIVLDGDSTTNGIRNVICLPGNFGPDRLVYDLLKLLDPTKFDAIKSGYTQQYCFKNLNTLDSSTDDTRTRKKLKDWYRSQRNNWGRSAIKVWDLWKQANKKEIDIFTKKLEKLINS